MYLQQGAPQPSAAPAASGGGGGGRAGQGLQVALAALGQDEAALLASLQRIDSAILQRGLQHVAGQVRAHGFKAYFLRLKAGQVRVQPNRVLKTQF